MSDSLCSDFTAFVDNRLDYTGRILKKNTDYNCQYANIEKCTQEILSAMPSELTITLGDIDDSYTELLNISERICYRQGFKDALRLMAEI